MQREGNGGGGEKKENEREASPLDIVEIWEDVRLDFLRYHSAAGIERVNNGG